MNELRGIQTDVELRAVGETGELRAVGYGVTFDQESIVRTPQGEFREIVRPGAFSAHLADNPNLRVTFNHNPDKVIGTTHSGTAIVTVDERGIRYDAELDPNDPDAVALRAKLEKRKVTGSSFTFNVPQGGATWHHPETRGGLPLREIRTATILELGPVTFPVYPTTTAEARDEAAAAATPIEIPTSPAPVPNYAKQLAWIDAAASLLK